MVVNKLKTAYNNFMMKRLKKSVSNGVRKYINAKHPPGGDKSEGLIYIYIYIYIMKRWKNMKMENIKKNENISIKI